MGCMSAAAELEIYGPIPWLKAHAYGGVRKVSELVDWHLYTSDLCEDTNDSSIMRVDTVKAGTVRRFKVAINDHVRVADRQNKLFPIAMAFSALNVVVLLRLATACTTRTISTSSSPSLKLVS